MANELIKKMQKGNVDALREGLASASALVRFDACGLCAAFACKDKEIINGIVAIKEDGTLFSGYTVAHSATAALHLLGVEPYSGEDIHVKNLIDSRFDFLR